MKVTLLKREDCFFHPFRHRSNVLTFKMKGRPEHYLHAARARPPCVAMEYFFQTSQSNRNNRHSEPGGDQADAWLKGLDFSRLGSLTFWEK